MELKMVMESAMQSQIEGAQVTYASMMEEIEDLQNSNAELLNDLQEAATTLRRYEKSHRAKGTADSTEKAEVNASLAARFEATIAKAKAINGE